MKALELRCVFNGNHYGNEKTLQMHKERLKNIRKVVDNSEPRSLSSRVHSPTRHLERKKEYRDTVAKDNLILARKIFNIMEGTSIITDTINDTRHVDNHPGTMNFKFRLSEAQRIHNRNMILAARLDSIQPYYKMSDIYVVQSAKKRKIKNKKSKFTRELEYAMNDLRGDSAPASTRSESPTTDYLKGFNFANSSTISAQHSLSARKSTDSEYSRQKPHTVLLEYTKVQDGRVLSVAVLKEPFRDRYAIFGIDVDVGQRYELRLTSDDVSSILDGDILVTSVDNVEVWMALLNKVSLNKVDDFAKLPFSGEEVDIFNAQQSGEQQHKLVASRPSTERPSSRAATGGRSRGGDGARPVATSTTTSQSVEQVVHSVVSPAVEEEIVDHSVKEEVNDPEKPETVSEKRPESGKRSVVPKLNIASQTAGSTRLATNKNRPEVPSSSVTSTKPTMSATNPHTSPRSARAAASSKPHASPPNQHHSKPTAPTIASPTASAPSKPSTFVRKSVKDAVSKSNNQKSSTTPSKNVNDKSKHLKQPHAPTDRPKTALELIVGESLIENAVNQAIYNVLHATDRAIKSRQGDEETA